MKIWVIFGFRLGPLALGAAERAPAPGGGGRRRAEGGGDEQVTYPGPQAAPSWGGTTIESAKAERAAGCGHHRDGD